MLWKPRLIYVRNCIAHASGLLNHYRHKEELRKSLMGFSGIKVSSINFLGEGIEIESGFLQNELRDIKQWLLRLEKVAPKSDLLKK